MSERSRCVVATAVALWMTPFAATLAQTSESVPPVAVDWRARAQGERGVQGDCPDAAYVEHEIERLLADAPRSATPRLHARAEVTHEVGGSWHVEVTTVSAQGNGHRSVTAETCGALARATALILALAVDPDRVAKNRTLDPTLSDPVTAAPVGPNATSSSTADAAAPPSTAAATATAKTTTTATGSATPTRIDTEPPVRARKRPGLPTTFALGASALVELGSLPFLGPGGGARLAAVPGFAPALRLELGAALWPWSQSAGATATSLGGTFALRAFEAGACLVPVAESWEFGPCAGAELAWLSGRASARARRVRPGSPATRYGSSFGRAPWSPTACPRYGRSAPTWAWAWHSTSTPGVAISTPPPVATPSAEASASPTRISSPASESPTPSSESASANPSRASASPSPPSASVSAGPMAASHTRAPATDVEAEVLLIAGAHSALQADDPARALILLDEHARRFPAGALGEERDASRVASLCALGRNAEARAAAARFLGAFPNSPHAARVRASCGAAEEPPF